jgi:hypothetical protein
MPARYFDPVDSIIENSIHNNELYDKKELYGAMLVEMLPDIRIICFDQKHRFNGFNIAVEISLRGCKP